MNFSRQTLLCGLWFFLSAAGAMAATYDVGYGAFEAPDDFSFERTGTKDSFMGALTRKSDGFKIIFDIGEGAGSHMSPAEKEKCVFFRTHTINGSFCWTGIERNGARQTIATTIYDQGERIRRWQAASEATRELPEEKRQKAEKELREELSHMPLPPAPPANFWAVISRDSDVAEFLLIVSSYRPKAAELNKKQ